ncbi:type IV pilin-like G/H family protein [Gloeocapsopsis crepidinum LEGE 06123]|uniref:Type IV pilin-like G/H family protein n=2 Tax=Gloeocapsopsis crepidinum TaxID=693223 RepID=A0ABR9UYP0_9CHRO|nr:type IV pilin-like G/H family protein [Gloeocapsopsis crepidinum LEGE 06123]
MVRNEDKVFTIFKKTNKNSNTGFTLIELLVIIIIIGILSAIAMPSFLGQTTKARQSEAKTNVGAMNRAQQTYYFENQTFVEDTNDTNAIGKLGIGVEDSVNYIYSATAINNIQRGVANKAKANNSELKGYAGGVFTASELSQAILCEANNQGMGVVASPTDANNCGGGSSKIK